MSLARAEAIVDAARVAETIEAALPLGVRARQLRVRSLLAGIILALVDGRPAHLSRVHAALVALPAPEAARLGVSVEWRTGPHALTYRQTEYTFTLVAAALAKHTPDGAPSDVLAGDALVEASVPAVHKQASTSLAVEWSDHETFSCPPVERGGDCADPEASWGPSLPRLSPSPPKSSRCCSSSSSDGSPSPLCDRLPDRQEWAALHPKGGVPVRVERIEPSRPSLIATL